MRFRILMLAVLALIPVVFMAQAPAVKELAFNSYDINYLDLKDNGVCIVAGKKAAGFAEAGSNSVTLLILDKDGKEKLNKEFTVDSRDHIRYLVTADAQGKYIYVVTFYKTKSKTGLEDAVLTRVDLEGNMLQKSFSTQVFGTPLHFFANSASVKMVCTTMDFQMKCDNKEKDCAVKLFSFNAADLSLTELSHDLAPAQGEKMIYWKPIRNEEASTTFYRVKSAEVEAKIIDLEFKEIDNTGKQVSHHEVQLTMKQWMPYSPSNYRAGMNMVNDNGIASAFTYKFSGGNGIVETTREPDCFCFIRNDPGNQCFWAYGRLSEDKKGKQSDGFFLAKISNDYKTEFINEYINLRIPSGNKRIDEPMAYMKLYFTADGITLIGNDILGTHYFSVEKKASTTIDITKVENSPAAFDGNYCQTKNFISADKAVRNQVNNRTETMAFCIGEKQYYVLNKWAEHKLLIYSK